MYAGILYVLFAHQDRPAHGLYSYNDSADSWEDTGVKFRQDHVIMIEFCDLVVCNNRLYLINQSLMDQRAWDSELSKPLDQQALLATRHKRNFSCGETLQEGGFR